MSQDAAREEEIASFLYPVAALPPTNMGRSLGLVRTALIRLPIFWALGIFKQYDGIQIGPMNPSYEDVLNCAKIDPTSCRTSPVVTWRPGLEGDPRKFTRQNESLRSIRSLGSSS